MSKNKSNRIWDAFTTVLVIILVIIALALVVCRITGIKAMTVLSGSMQPTYRTGSLIFVKNISENDVKVGDPITYLIADNKVVTHRVVEIIPDENDPDVIRFRTKGDANEVNDASPVHENNLVGKPIFSIPFAGYLVFGIQNPPGKYIAIALAALILIFTFKKEEKENEEN